jgi:hypothetical protein
MNFNAAITLALDSQAGYAKAIDSLRAVAANMERSDFRQKAVPIVAAKYKVQPIESQKGGLSLEKDTAAYKALSRIIAHAYGGAVSLKTPKAAVRLNATERALAAQLAGYDKVRMQAIVARARELAAASAE